MIDEAHHVAENGQYEELLRRHADARQFGVTATPWRGDEYDISFRFGEGSFTLGIEEGMRRGYLAQVDYRLFVDNVDWDVVRSASRHSYSLAELNASSFSRTATRRSAMSWRPPGGRLPSHGPSCSARPSNTLSVWPICCVAFPAGRAPWPCTRACQSASVWAGCWLSGRARCRFSPQWTSSMRAWMCRT